MQQSQNPFLYPGQGIKLRRVNAGTGNAITIPETTVIANNGFSEAIAGHDCLELIFNFVFAAAATGDVLIEQGETIDFPNNGKTLATITAAAEFAKTYAAGKPLTGFFRIKNTSGQNLTVYCQKRIN